MIDVETLYRKYGPMVIRRCRQLLGEEEKALDASQEVFVRLLRYRKRLLETRPYGLLYRIATNVCLNVIRSDNRHPQVRGEEIIAAIAAADDPYERAENKDLLNRIFHREKESTRTIAVLHYVDRLTLEETAREVGLSVSGVRNRLRHLSEHGLAFKETT